MAIIQAICTSFKVDLLGGLHNFKLSGGDAFMVALYTNLANLGASTPAYTATAEVSSSGTGYSTGGSALTRVDPTFSGTTAFVDFADITWSSSAITARGALIYNNTLGGNNSVMVLNFGSDKTSSSGDFTILFPAADANNAIIRIT